MTSDLNFDDLNLILAPAQLLPSHNENAFLFESDQNVYRGRALSISESNENDCLNSGSTSCPAQYISNELCNISQTNQNWTTIPEKSQEKSKEQYPFGKPPDIRWISHFEIPNESCNTSPSSKRKAVLKAPLKKMLDSLPPYYRMRIPKFRRAEDQWRSFVGALLMESENLIRTKAMQRYNMHYDLERLSSGRWIEICKCPKMMQDRASEKEMLETTSNDLLESKNNSPICGNISVNVSHSKDFVFYGSSRNFHIGVDIQNFNLHNLNLEAVSSVFTHREIRWCKTNSRIIPKLWCLKEACVKAIGFGLSFEPTRIEVESDLWHTIPPHTTDESMSNNDHLEQSEIKNVSEKQAHNEKKSEFRVLVDGEYKDWKLYMKEFIHEDNYYCVAVALVPIHEVCVHEELQKYYKLHHSPTLLPHKSGELNSDIFKREFCETNEKGHFQVECPIVHTNILSSYNLSTLYTSILSENQGSRG